MYKCRRKNIEAYGNKKKNSFSKTIKKRAFKLLFWKILSTSKFAN